MRQTGELGLLTRRAFVAMVSRPFEVDLWDQWCTYDRLSAVVFPRPFAGGERITIKPVRASPAAPDQSGPPRLSVIGFMAVA